MSQRVTISSKVKVVTAGAVAKESLNRALELLGVDPKPGELSMARLKRE